MCKWSVISGQWSVEFAMRNSQCAIDVGKSDPRGSGDTICKGVHASETATADTAKAEQEEKSRQLGAIKFQRECILNDALPLFCLRKKYKWRRRSFTVTVLCIY